MQRVKFTRSPRYIAAINQSRSTVNLSPYQTRHFSNHSSSKQQPSVWVVDNPFTGETFVEIPLHNEQQVNEFVHHSQLAQKSFASSTSLQQRQSLVESFCQLMHVQKERIAIELTCQMGKPINQSRRG